MRMPVQSLRAQSALRCKAPASRRASVLVAA